MMRRSSLLLMMALLLPHGVCHADLIKQSTTYNRTVLMTDSTDHVTGKTGLTLAIVASKAGGAEATITPVVTEVGHGKYSLALTTTHTNTFGALDLYITAAGADPSDTHDQVVAFDPTDAAALGLSRLDAAVSSRSTYAGGDTSGTTTLLTRIPGTIQPQTGDSFARLGVAGAGLTALGDTRLGFLTGDAFVRLGAPAGASHAADIAAVPASVWTVGTRQLTATQTFSLTGNITGNLSGSVGSVTGAVGSITGITFPTNFSLFSLDGSGRVTVGGYATGFSPKEQVINLAIPGESGVTFGQALYVTFLNSAGRFGTPTRAVVAPWTITVPFLRASDGVTVFYYVTTYTDSTFARTISRSYVAPALPAP